MHTIKMISGCLNAVKWLQEPQLRDQWFLGLNETDFKGQLGIQESFGPPKLDYNHLKPSKEE